MADPHPASEKLEALRRRWRQEHSPQLTLQLAEEFARSGQAERAVEVLEEGLREHPKHLSSRVALGRYRFELGRTEAAARALESVVSADPTHLVANKLLVRVYSRLGNGQRATDRLDLYSLLNESDPEIEELQQMVRDSVAPASEPLELPESEEPPATLERIEPPPPPPPAEEPVAIEPEPVEPPRPAPAASEPAFSAPPEDPFPGLWEGLETEVYRRALAAEGIFGAGEEAVEPSEALFGPADEEPAEVHDGGTSLESVAAPEALPPLEPEAAPAATEQPTAAAVPSATASVTLADLYREQGHLDRAVAVLRSVLEREPGNREALERLATLARSPSWRLTAYDLLDGSSFAAGGSPDERRAALLRGYLERIRGQGGGHV